MGKFLDVRLNKIHAREILDMFDDWDEDFVSEDPGYQDGYIGATKDILSTLNLNRRDIEDLLK
ncbi:hypothetical protein [Aquibacillus saliphilus]|uniref:hypothetical protein n=1 Tax=Aquibacillus saliphilus TaxID=1909422 RepID=UPI001CF07EDF|nr:hypothetical protein [Aquibacillus saliphilus]